MDTRVLYLTVFVSGMSVMGVEMAASRLLAPYFGTSLIVWTCLIGIIMVALTVGYQLGGRRADARPDPASFYRTVLLGGVLTLAIPAVSGPVLGATLKTGALGVILGAFVGVALLFAVPVGIMGMTSPYAIRLVSTSPEAAGRSAGSIYALSTAGSIIGTFLPGFAMIPWLGTRLTILTFGALLVAVALLGLARPGVAVVTCLGLAAAATSLSPVKTLPGMVEGRESLYNYIQVIDRDLGDRTRRLLVLNEGRAVHSVYDPKSPAAPLVGAVWDAMNVLPVLAYSGKPMKGAVVGLAAGTMAKQWLHFFGPAWDLRVDGAEIDPEILAVGRKYFGMAEDEASGRLAAYAEDGRTFLRDRESGSYDFILTDAYKQPYIPFHLATREYFELVHSRLKEGGIVAINVGAIDVKAEIFVRLLSTVGAVFGEVRYVLMRNRSVPFNNHVVVAAKGKVDWTRLNDRANPALAKVLDDSRNPALRGVFYTAQSELHRFDDFDPAKVFTDDLAPVELFTEKMIWDYVARGGGVPSA